VSTFKNDIAISTVPAVIETLVEGVRQPLQGLSKVEVRLPADAYMSMVAESLFCFLPVESTHK
jgi:hypothetical protein